MICHCLLIVMIVIRFHENKLGIHLQCICQNRDHLILVQVIPLDLLEWWICLLLCSINSFMLLQREFKIMLSQNTYFTYYYISRVFFFNQNHWKPILNLKFSFLIRKQQKFKNFIRLEKMAFISLLKFCKNHLNVLKERKLPLSYNGSQTDQKMIKC